MISNSGRLRGLAFAIITTALLMVAASAPSPFYPELAEQLGMQPVAMTLVFAVYAFTMLASLLLTGSLSDSWGRRPVVAIGALALAASLLLFWQASSVAVLLVARGLQGIAAGILLPALSAMVVDFSSPQRPQGASLWNTIGAMTGLGIGAISAAFVLDTVADAVAVVFVTLASIFVLIAALVWVMPDASRSRATPRQPSRGAVPVSLHRPLRMAVPAIIVGWASNGLFLALSSTVLRSEFGSTNHWQQSIAIPIFASAGILTAVLLHQRSAKLVSMYGTSVLGIGTVLSMAALALHSLPAYLLAVAVMGSGFGTAFMGVLKTLMPRVDASNRAAVMSVIYAVSYLAFGVPTIIAGLLVPAISLSGAMIVLGGAIVLLCALATVQRSRIRDEMPVVTARTRPQSEAE